MEFDMPGRNTQSVFFEALEQDSPEKLIQFLDKACSDDALLRSQLEELLRAHRNAGDFLGGPSEANPVGEAVDQETEDQTGKQIGPFKILQEIGEGGFGVVYMAEQSRPVERKVARTLHHHVLEGMRRRAKEAPLLRDLALKESLNTEW